MKAYIKWVFTVAIDPTTWVRLWNVEYGGWCGGKIESFWIKKNAERFAKQRAEPFVYIENEATGARIVVRDNPEKTVPDVRRIYIKM